MDFQRILIVIFAQLGDVLLTTPLIRATRERWPHARIDVLGYAGTLALLAGNPDVSALIEMPHRDTPRGHLRTAARLWRRYDLALVARVGDRSHVAGFIAAPRRSVMVPGDKTGRWKRWIAQHAFEPHPDSHQMLLKLRLISPWAELPASLTVRPPPAAPLPEALARSLRHPCVVVHVPSMWRYKQWPTAHFRVVIEHLLARGVQVVLTGSGSANDQALVAQVRDLGCAPELIDVSGQVSLQQLRTLLEHADAYFGPDTSITHLAAALDRPIVTVFGPTRPVDFGPWPQGHPAQQPWTARAQRQQVRRIVLLQGPDRPGQRCMPCNRMGCEHRHDSASHCLEQLAPERVIAELERIVGAASTAVGPS